MQRTGSPNRTSHYFASQIRIIALVKLKLSKLVEKILSKNTALCLKKCPLRLIQSTILSKCRLHSGERSGTQFLKKSLLL